MPAPDHHNHSLALGPIFGVRLSWVVWSVTWRGQHLSAPIKAYETVLAGYTMEYDFLGALADALDARDIKLMFYYHPGHEDGAWWNAYTGRRKGGADRLDVDRSRWYRNFCLITQEIGIRYGHRLHGWLIDGARHYYPAPYETLTAAMKAGNNDRIVAYNSYFFPRVTDFQDFMFGEGVFYPTSGDVQGIIRNAYHKGLQGHGMWILSGPDWGLFDPKRVPADPQRNIDDWLASLAKMKTLKVATSPCLTMTPEGGINRKAYDLLVASRRQFRDISDQQLIETRRARGAKNTAASSYIRSNPSQESSK